MLMLPRMHTRCQLCKSRDIRFSFIIIILFYYIVCSMQCDAEFKAIECNISKCLCILLLSWMCHSWNDTIFFLLAFDATIAWENDFHVYTTTHCLKISLSFFHSSISVQHIHVTCKTTMMLVYRVYLVRIFQRECEWMKEWELM